MHTPGRSLFRVALALAALSGAACTKDRETSFDKTTNWLRVCGGPEGCGEGLRCVCGVCTAVCDSHKQCAQFDDWALCVDVDRVGSGCETREAVAHVCTLGCMADDACNARDDQLMCVAGACASSLEQSSVNDSTPDATMGDMEAGVLDAGSAPDGTSAAEVVVAEIDPALVAAVAADCGAGAGFKCEPIALATNRIAAIAPAADFVYFVDPGTRDALDNPRRDGSITRVSKSVRAQKAVVSALDRPWRLFVDDQSLYWLSGEVSDAGVGQGDQTLYRRQIDASAAPELVLRDVFARLVVRKGELFWQSPYSHLEPNDSIQVRRYSVTKRSDVWMEYYVPKDYTFAGVNDTYLYLEDGKRNLMRGGTNGADAVPFVSDTPAYSLNVASDALWLIHTGSDGNAWVSTMAEGDGTITHVGRADGYVGPPQPGASVVWLVTGAGPVWFLEAIPKSGGERVLAFRFPTEHGIAGQDAPAAVWTADGDDAWVYADKALVRVRAGASAAAP